MDSLESPLLASTLPTLPHNNIDRETGRKPHFLRISVRPETVRSSELSLRDESLARNYRTNMLKTAESHMNDTLKHMGTNSSTSGGYYDEPNPFEAQFRNPSYIAIARTFGLPPVASLASPLSLTPDDPPRWNSLRTGPLSPAMLAGPTMTSYF